MSPNQSQTIHALDRAYLQHRDALERQARAAGIPPHDSEDLASTVYPLARTLLDITTPHTDLPSMLASILAKQITEWHRLAKRRPVELNPEITLDDTPYQASQRHSLRLRLIARIHATHLTARQEQCLLLALDGHTEAAIGHHLCITQQMVSLHLQAAKRKLTQTDPDEVDPDIAELFRQSCIHARYTKPGGMSKWWRNHHPPEPNFATYRRIHGHRTQETETK